MKLLLTSVFLLVGLSAKAAEPKHTICFPQTGVMMPQSVDSGADATGHKVFDAAIDRVYNHYAPILAKKGITLQFNRLWSDPTVNSDTTESSDGKVWTINAYGGLFRYKGMGRQPSYTGVACHELGHHMGGFPTFDDGSGMSVEGEADYWAAKECMPAVGYSKALATEAFVDLSDVLSDLSGEAKPDPAKIDTSVVMTTYEDHPESQCRLDTYLNGIACPARGPMSKSNPRVNSCYSYPTQKTYGLGSRPRCWFAPIGVF